jgi:hypothetical protein
MLRHAAGQVCPPVGFGWLLLVLTVTGCGESQSYLEKEKALRERPIGSLKEQGATFALKHYPNGTSAWAIDMHGMTITDEMLEDLKKVGHITELNLSRSTITDQQLAIVNQRPISGFLMQLDLSKTAITDAGLDQLKDLGFLQSLNLSDTKVTAAGVERFKKARAEDQRVQFKNAKIVR